VDCNAFTPAVCMRSMTTWEKYGTFLSWTWAERLPMAAWRGPGGGWQRAEFCLAYLEADPFYSSSIGPSTCTWGGSKPGCKLRLKVNGAPRTGACEHHGGSPGWQLYLTARWTFGWGPLWDWKGSMYNVHGGSTPGRQWATESGEGHVTGAC